MASQKTDRLPQAVQDMVAAKVGFVVFHWTRGKIKEEATGLTAKEFNTSTDQAHKIVRRITGWVRFFQRSFSLTGVLK
ncbi:MAG: hypothetical protein H7A46_20430 [Verrucomicrobiales bacterium]|nr:hypothetical protein [Verrucomicrobiales bacterium]